MAKFQNIDGTIPNDFSIGTFNDNEFTISPNANEDSGNNPRIKYNKLYKTFSFKDEHSDDNNCYSYFATEWKALSPWTDFVTDPDDNETLDTTEESLVYLSGKIYAGMPIRIMKNKPTVYTGVFDVNGNDDGGVISTSFSGVNLDYYEQLMDKRGRIYAKLSQSLNYLIRFYKDSSLKDASLIGHTDSIAGGANVTVNINEDNNSGLGGTIRVNTTKFVVSNDWYFEYFMWHIVSAFNATTDRKIVLQGPPLPTGETDEIIGMWYGLPEKVALIPIFISGGFAVAASETLLTSFLKMYGGIPYDGPSARIVGFKCLVDTLGAAQPKINITTSKPSAALGHVCSTSSNAGLTVAAARTWYITTSDIRTHKCVIEKGDFIEVTTTIADASVNDLNISLILVLE